MSHHSSDFENAAADLVEHFGQPIFYTDPDVTTPVEVDACVFPERTERRQNPSGGWNKVQIRDVKFDEAAITLRLDGKFTIDGEKYVIDSSGKAVEGRLLVKLKRVTAGEVSRPGTRR